jgi:hypothetical protein
MPSNNSHHKEQVMRNKLPNLVIAASTRRAIVCSLSAFSLSMLIGWLMVQAYHQLFSPANLPPIQRPATTTSATVLSAPLPISAVATDFPENQVETRKRTLDEIVREIIGTANSKGDGDICSLIGEAQDNTYCYNHTQVLFAAKRRDARAVKLFIDPANTASDSDTASSNVKALRYLASHRAVSEIEEMVNRDMYHEAFTTALIQAAKEQDISATKSLIAGGSSWQQECGTYDLQPIVCTINGATTTSDRKALKLLVKLAPHHALRALSQAAELGETETALALIDAGVDINGYNNFKGNNALMKALSFSQFETAKALLKKGARPTDKKIMLEVARQIDDMELIELITHRKELK